MSLLFVLTTISGQHLKKIDKKLNATFGKIDYWSSFSGYNEKINPSDSLENANDLFEKMLLEYTSSNSQTISYSFKDLADNGLKIVTSESGLFRIYSWDTSTGGTMHYYRNVFQYKEGTKVFSKTFERIRALPATNIGLASSGRPATGNFVQKKPQYRHTPKIS